MTQLKISRRNIVFGALALAGCGEAKTARSLVDAFRISLIGHPDVPISRSAIGRLPYASIRAKIGKGPRSILILWRVDHDDLHWLSADAAAIVTRMGRVVKTAGLPENIRDTRSLAQDPLAIGITSQAAPDTYVRTVDVETDGPLYQLKIESRFREVGARRITIAEIEFDTILFEEICKATTLNWSFRNRFWVDPADGFVWRSEQTIARAFPQITIEVLKPPA